MCLVSFTNLATRGHNEAGVTNAPPYLYTVAPNTGQWTDQQPLMYVTEYGGVHQQAALAPPVTKLKATAKEGTKQRKQAASSSDKTKPVTKLVNEKVIYTATRIETNLCVTFFR